MQVNPEYNDYYVYSSLIRGSDTLTYGACPVVWRPEVVQQGGKWKPGLTWADGNYHLIESELSEENAGCIEECIYIALNEAEETSGNIILEDQALRVRWCLMEKHQILVVMNLPD